VAKRLARLALARDYGYQIPHQSPQYESMEKKGNKIVLTFKDVGSTLYSFDVREPEGFAIAGADQKWHWAEAKILGKDKVEVWSAGVADPVAVRYAWSDNPVATLRSRENLPVIPFRTDDWPMITEPKAEAKEAAPAPEKANPEKQPAPAAAKKKPATQKKQDTPAPKTEKQKAKAAPAKA
jgi:sialate O-acetylesterase